MTCLSELSWLVCFLQFCFGVSMVAVQDESMLLCIVEGQKDHSVSFCRS